MHAPQPHMPPCWACPCHACPPTMHTPPAVHAPPTMHALLPCMPHCHAHTPAMHTTPPPPVDRETPVKTLPSQTSFTAVIISNFVFAFSGTQVIKRYSHWTTTLAMASVELWFLLSLDVNITIKVYGTHLLATYAFSVNKLRVIFGCLSTSKPLGFWKSSHFERYSVVKNSILNGICH